MPKNSAVSGHVAYAETPMIPLILTWNEKTIFPE
jgi:hypothetical protein